MTKVTILILSVMLSLLTFVAEYSYRIGLCDVGDVLCRNDYRTWGSIFLFSPFLLLFSLITYFTPDRIFQSWWKFARLAIPVCFILSAIILYDASKSTDFFDKVIYMPALTLIYGVFTIGSTWQIWKGFKQK